ENGLTLRGLIHLEEQVLDRRLDAWIERLSNGEQAPQRLVRSRQNAEIFRPRLRDPGSRMPRLSSRIGSLGQQLLDELVAVASPSSLSVHDRFDFPVAAVVVEPIANL